MKDFLKMMLASITGLILGSVILGLILMIVFAGIAASASSTPSYHLNKQSILHLELEGTVSEREKENPMKFLMGDNTKNTGLDDILDAIKKAKENENIEGIYIEAGSFHAGIASLEPIRNALIDFKKSGKFIVAYGSFYTQGAYYLAAVADKIIMNPQGMFDFHGLASNVEFYKGTFEKIGVKMQVFKVGTYKSAVEPFIQDKMSDANKEQVTAFLHDIWGHLLKGISESRNISVENLNLYADQCLAFSSPDSIVKYRLIDTLMYSTDVTNYLKELVCLEKNQELELAKISEIKTVPFSKENKSKEKIAVLYAEGAIIGDEAQNTYTSSENITAKQYVKELQKLKDNKEIKAIVFRVNSPGGSAFASEQIWNAVKEVKKIKPVIVSMGDYAASGGYYISCAADQIVAEPTTLTGSIGIFGIIPEGEELSRRLGLTYDGVSTNKHSDFGASGIPLIGMPIKPFDEDEQSMIQAYIERGYETFLTRCADGRFKSKADIDSIAQGRVWTGNQALKLGLIDKIGGLEDAIKIAAEKAKISDYRLEKFPKQKDFFTQLIEESFGEIQSHIKEGVLGEEKYEQSMLVNSLKSFDCRMAVMPYTIQK